MWKENTVAHFFDEKIEHSLLHFISLCTCTCAFISDLSKFGRRVAAQITFSHFCQEHDAANQRKAARAFLTGSKRAGSTIDIKTY